MDILYNWEKWTDWVKLDGLELLSVTNEPGVYVVATCHGITRAAGIDANGFLDVGESEYLRDRLESFIRCAQNPDSYGHMAGVRFSFLGFSESFPFESLWVRWIIVKDKLAAFALEGQILKKYVNLHQELPPLNYKYNWSNHS